MTIIADGKAIAQKYEHYLKQQVASLPHPVVFHIVYIGHNPVIDNYLSYKKRFAERIGVTVQMHRFEESVEEEVVYRAVQELVLKNEPMIIQLPLPEHFNTEALLNLIPPHLDVDVLSQKGRERFFEGANPLTPPVVAAIVTIFEIYEIDLTNKKIVCVGEGKLVGGPFGAWLTNHEYSYDVITHTTDSETRKHLLKEADVLVSGVGVPGMITEEDIKEGVILIDAGTSESGAYIHGDMNISLPTKASFITPVPGGIGPLTIAMLYRNVIDSYHDERNHRT